MPFSTQSSRIAAIRDTRGASLIVALSVTMLLMLLASGSFAAVLSFLRVTHQVERANAAYFAAESGVELALYDLAAYDDGYQFTPTDTVCTDRASATAALSATAACSDDQPYRVVDFSGEKQSGARGFWRLFSRALHEDQNPSNPLVVPDPFFVGDKDGQLAVRSGLETEWGRITKAEPISFSLMADVAPAETDPTVRYDYLTPDRVSAARVTLMVDPADLVDGVSLGGSEPLLLWTLSAIDGGGIERTLQGVVRESDITQRDCDGNGVADDWCVEIDLLGDIMPLAVDNLAGGMLAGEDINKNIANDDAAPNMTAVFNRVSGVTHDWHMNSPYDFLVAMQDARDSATVADGYAAAWRGARFSVSMIGTLSETSNLPSDSLLYRFSVVPQDASLVVADEYSYIISEGFSATVKQTIETKFRRQSTISVFSYAIFQ